MRKIYLVRHGEPLIAPGKKLCLGQTDLILSETGQKQAINTVPFLKKAGITAVFASPLKRTLETANIFADRLGLKGKVQTEDGLKEINLGAWDGLEFSKIKEEYPAEYEERGKNLASFRSPGGENFSEAGERFAGCFKKIIGKTEGNIIIVSHAGVIKTLLCRLTGTDLNNLNDFNIPYASITELEMDGETTENLRIINIGFRPSISLSLSEVSRIYGECRVTPEIIAHMEMVADTAMNIVGYERSLVKSDVFDSAWEFEGSTIDTRELYFAALLHDIKRADGREHAKTGADYIAKYGFKEIAEIIRPHHDAEVYKPDEPLSNAEILYYADKLVQGDVMVTIEERFAKSREKCTTPEAIAAHDARYQAALGIQKKVGF